MATATRLSDCGTPESKDVYAFTFVLSGIREITKEIEDALFEAGCDDAVFGNHAGTPYLAFDREADSLEDAIRSALVDVEGCEVEVVKVVPPGADTIETVNAFLRTRRQLHSELDKLHGSLSEAQIRGIDDVLKSALGGSEKVLQILAGLVPKD